MNQMGKELVRLMADSQFSVGIRSVRKTRFPANYRYENHAHPEVEIDYVNSGCCIMEAGEDIVTLRPGDCIIMNPWTSHLYMVDVAKSCCITQLIYRVTFPGAADGGELACFDYSRPYHVLAECGDLCELMEFIHRFYKRSGRDEYIQTQLDLLMLQLFVMISGYMARERTAADSCGGKLGAVLERINSRLGEDINLEELAKELGVSSRYIRKLFSEQMGVSCSGYITTLRVEKAKTILRETEKGITETAALSGFNSPQYFCRVFRQYVGMTPAEYRRMQSGSVR